MATGLELHLAARRRDYRTPGVYYEERRLGEIGIRALQTGVPAFVGFAQGKAASADARIDYQYLTRWEQYDDYFITSGSRFLAYAIRGFFENGGRRCVVIPVKAQGRDQYSRSAALMTAFAPQAVLEDLLDIDLICIPDAIGALVDRAEGNSDTSNRDRVAQAVSHWQRLSPTKGALYFPWIYVEPFEGTPIADGGVISRDATLQVQCAALEHCERMGNRFAILDAPPNPGRGHDVHSHGHLIPPCGHIAGIFSRSDARIGVHKAPANETVERALNVDVELTEQQHGELNIVGINCLRSYPGRGIQLMGARTLSGSPSWRYVNVMRLFLTLTRWVEENMHDLIFEPNDASLWDRIRDRAATYCHGLFQQGALKGDSPGQAYFVKCDAETNPFEGRESGQVIAHIGLAPSVPAEFVIVRITQSVSGVTLTIPSGSQ